MRDLSFHLPQAILNRILSMPPPYEDAHNDLLTPSFTLNGGFSLAQAYDAQLPTPWTNLDWIWKNNIEPKLKFFFWLLWKDHIPHMNLLHIRNIMPNSHCPRCSNIGEDSPILFAIAVIRGGFGIRVHHSALGCSLLLNG